MAESGRGRRNLVALLLAATVCCPVLGQELATDQLLIRGATLVVSPAHQEIDPGRPTVVNTSLGQLAPGEIPAGMRVVGELTGPGLESPLSLSAVPGEPFRIPGLSREGTYVLGGIRLVQGEEILQAADPDSVEIVVHRLVIASVTSRPLTREEIDAAGIVISDDSYTVVRYTVAFATQAGQFEIPFDLLSGPDGITALPERDPYQLPTPSTPQVASPPQVNVVNISIPGTELPNPPPEAGGETPASVPGFLVIPGDVSFLHQFFSAILVIQNGALAESGIELRDLSGMLQIDDDGLRQAETEPPTVPGESVPIVDPGPDGRLGTNDDLTFIVAQSSGQASWLIEGLEEGQHLIKVHVTGEIDGLASGRPAPIDTSVPGVVIVRDPRFALTFIHPWIVRAGETYQLQVVVTNTSTTPVYDLHMSLPDNELSGVQLVDPGEYDQTVDELPPSGSATVTWDLLSLKTGRVVASAFNTSSSTLTASFRFHAGVGELGIPLSPDSLVLPPEVYNLPESVTGPAIELLGLAHSLANAPPGAEVDLPPVSEGMVIRRGQELAAVARRAALGDDQDRCLVDLGLKWLGASTWDSGFDALRRASTRGRSIEEQLAAALGRRIDVLGVDGALAEAEELAITGRPMLIVVAEGAGYGRSARLALSGSASQLGAAGQSADTTFYSRALPGAAILEVSVNGFQGEVGVVAIPVEDEGSWTESSYQVQLHGLDAGSVSLSAVIVMPDGSTRRVVPADLGTAEGSLAFFTVGPADDSVDVHVDDNGDQTEDGVEHVSVVLQDARAPRLLFARFDSTVQPPDGGPYRGVLLLFSQIIDTEALGDVDASQWTVDSHLELSASDDTLIVDRPRTGQTLIQQIDPHFLVLGLSAPLNPHAQIRLSSGGTEVPFIGGGALSLDEQAIDTGNDLPSGAVRGVVVGGDGAVVPGAHVELYESVRIGSEMWGDKWLLARSDSVTADASGRFIFDAVRARDGQLQTQYGAFLVRAVDPETSHEARVMARLTGDATVRDLTVAMVGRGDVVGTLSREDGSPLTEPVIEARSVVNPEEYAVATIAGDGSYVLAGLPVGPVQVAARDGETFVYATAMVPGPGQQARLDIVLPVGQPQPTGDVEGVVVSASSGDPVAGVQVYLVPDGQSGAVAFAVTDEDGAFAMSGVPATPSWFKAFDPTRRIYVGQQWADLLADTTNNVQILANEVSTGSIEGTVYRNVSGLRTPVSGAYVMASGSGSTYAVTDDEGSYRIDELPLGTISLSVTDPTTGEGASRSVTLTAEGQVLTVDFDLTQASGSIQGTVVDPAGNPVAGVHLAADRFGSGHEGVSDGDGGFTLEGLAPGAHQVLASLQGGERLGRATASILYNGDVAEVTVVLGGTVSVDAVTVADTTGGGTPNPVLSQFAYRKPGITSMGGIGQIPDEGWLQCVQGDSPAECYIDDDGYAHFQNLPEGAGALTIQATNEFYGQVIVSEALDPSDDGTTITINFSAPGMISGKVFTDDNGSPAYVGGATVQLWVSVAEGFVPQQTVTSDENGAYTFELVNRGEFLVHAYDPGTGTAGWLRGSISSGQVIDDLNIQLRPLGGVEGGVSICTPTNAPASPGEEVHLQLWMNGAPRPFIDDFTPPAMDNREADIDLDSDPHFSFAGLLAGSWTLRATSSLHGTAFVTFTVPADGSTLTLEDPVCLHPAGSITGIVRWPETGEPVSGATVQLIDDWSWSILVTDTTAEDGSFTFDPVPVGSSYLVAAYEAGSNRGGLSSPLRLCDESDSGFGTTCFKDYQIEVALQPQGTVEGTVRTHDGTAVPNAFVRLRARVVKNQNGAIIGSDEVLWAYTDGAGGYSFDGVPAGAVEVTAYDPDGPLHAAVEGTMDPVANPVTTIDLDLPPTVDVTVQVLDPDGQPLVEGDPVIAFQQYSNHFREPSGGGGTVEHLVQGSPTIFSGVVDGDYRIGACLGACTSATVRSVLDHQFTQDLGAYANVTMPDPPEAHTVDLQLVGRASVQVTVKQGSNPVNDAAVTVSGSGFYGGVQLVKHTMADGTLETPFEGLGVGSYTVAATLTDDSGNVIRGASSLEITQSDHGQTLLVNVSLENAGAASGVVLDAAGEAAVGALVSMTYPDTGGPRLFQTVTQEGGTFQFPALPSGRTYELEISEGGGGTGLYRAHDIEITSEKLDLGTLQLDDTNPTVAAIDPANGAQDVAPDGQMVIDFSEPMRTDSLTDSVIVLRRGSQHVSVNLATEEVPDPDGDGPLGPFTRVTLTPPVLDSDVLYLVDVLRGVEDLAGRTLAYDFHSTFQTADTVPPTVVLVAPANDPEGATPVGPDVEPVVTFSEVIDTASVDETTVRLLDAGGSDVTVQRVAQGDGFAVRLRPDTGLALDSFFTVSVAGVTDTSGNVMTSPFESKFRVRDAEAPVVTLLPPEGVSIDGDIWSVVEGTPLTLRALVTSNDEVASVAFSVDGTPAGGTPVLDPASGEYQLAWTSTAAPGQVTLGAQATDVSGNLSDVAAHILVVTDDAPPTGTLVVDPAAEVLPNHVLTVTVNAQDDHGLAQAHISLTGALTTAANVAFPAGTTGQVSKTFRIPTDAAAGAQVTVDGSVEDTLEQTTPLTPATLTVLADAEPPTVTTVSPTPAAAVTAGDVVTFTFDLTDNVQGSTVSLTVGDDTPTVQLANIVDPGDQWTAQASAQWTAPSVTDSIDVSYSLTVTDPAGNSTDETGTITVQPLVNPYAPVVAIGCPVDGDPCLPDTQLTVSFSITDDDQIQSYDVLVNGAPAVTGVTVDATSIDATYDWTPPTGAQPGDAFTIRIEATDYAGNVGSAQITVTALDGPFLSGDQPITDAHVGETLILGPGIFTIDSNLDELTPDNLILVQGAKLTTSAMHPLAINSTGTVHLACGATLDVTGLGYAGGTSGAAGYAPDGVGPSQPDAGGSHGGLVQVLLARRLTVFTIRRLVGVEERPRRGPVQAERAEERLSSPLTCWCLTGRSRRRVRGRAVVRVRGPVARWW